MKQLFSIAFLVLLQPLCALNLTENGPDFDTYQRTLTYERAQEKIEKELQKDKEVANWYRMTPTELQILGPLDHAGNQPIEFTLFFGQKPSPKSSFPISKNASKPLEGYRIAIDPGHMGGDLARLEEKYIQMPINPKRGILEEIYFDEGTLALETAQILADHLRSYGAKVLLTKEEVGKGVLEKDFATWLKEDFSKAVSFMLTRQDNLEIQNKEKNYWEKIATPTEIFRSTYNFLDVQQRAEKINAFNPHLTISCHYNLGGIYDKSGNTPGTGDDFTLFFVPGAFKKGSLKDEKFRNSSLKSERSRYEFVRLLVTDNLENSIELAKIAQKCASKSLQLPKGDHCAYLRVLCLQQAPGIYHRNLSLCRLVHSPILYGEPLCQDNFEQVKRLSKHPKEVTQQMADIYTEAILEWAKTR